MTPDSVAQKFSMHASKPSAIRSPVQPGQRNFPSSPIPTAVLFQGAQEILIRHNDEHYHLRITKNGKLILTK